MDFDAYRKAYFVYPAPEQRYQFQSSFGATLYFEDYQAAIAFYAKVLGPPGYVEGASTRGWPVGNGWLTLLQGRQGNPQNVEITLELGRVHEAEALQKEFIAAGAKGQEPSDQFMYRPVRCCSIVDPFGMSIMIIAPIMADRAPG